MLLKTNQVISTKETNREDLKNANKECKINTIQEPDDVTDKTTPL